MLKKCLKNVTTTKRFRKIHEKSKSIFNEIIQNGVLFNFHLYIVFPIKTVKIFIFNYFIKIFVSKNQ